MNIPDPILNRAIKRLHQLKVYKRWLFVLFCWLTFAPFALWKLRGEISLWQEHFTWAAVRYGLADNLLPSFCLFFSIGITVAVLVWQSQNILQGLSDREKQSLVRQVKKIQASGPRHPLWKWLFGNYNL
jgi:hypothetical protein